MIDVRAQIEERLATALNQAPDDARPRRLAAAMKHAVFSGGARVRPQICLAVAGACDADNPRIALAAATAIELLHCAAKIRNELNCLDKGLVQPVNDSLPSTYGERLAMLASNTLNRLALDTLADSCVESPARSTALLNIVTSALRLPAEPALEAGPAARQHAKTCALFASATMAGAAAAAQQPEAWHNMGHRLGEACLVAQDPRLDQASSHAEMNRLVGLAVDAIPACAKAAELRLLIVLEAKRFFPSLPCRRVA